MMRSRIWPMSSPVVDIDHVESRFPAGTRSGEGSASLHKFLEAARRIRVQAGLPGALHQPRRTRGVNE